jgi:hypothetical protein
MTLRQTWAVGAAAVLGCSILGLSLAGPSPAQPQANPAAQAGPRPGRYQLVPCTSGAVRCVLVDTDTGQCWERVVRNVGDDEWRDTGSPPFRKDK